jgi:hypothetical protein
MTRQMLKQWSRLYYRERSSLAETGMASYTSGEAVRPAMVFNRPSRVLHGSHVEHDISAVASSRRNDCELTYGYVVRALARQG